MTQADSASGSRNSPPPPAGEIITDNVRFHLARRADAVREEALARPPTDDDPDSLARDLQFGDRLEEIRRKIAEGFYNRNEVRRRIADNLDDEITSL